MTRKAARGLVLDWLLLAAAGQVFSGKDRLRLRPGETVRALMPEGDPVKTSVVLKLVAAAGSWR